MIRRPSEQHLVVHLNRVSANVSTSADSQLQKRLTFVLSMCNSPELRHQNYIFNGVRVRASAVNRIQYCSPSAANYDMSPLDTTSFESTELNFQRFFRKSVIQTHALHASSKTLHSKKKNLQSLKCLYTCVHSVPWRPILKFLVLACFPAGVTLHQESFQQLSANRENRKKK